MPLLLFLAVAVLLKKRGRYNSGNVNDLLSRIEGDLGIKKTYTTAKKARS